MLVHTCPFHSLSYYSFIYMFYTFTSFFKAAFRVGVGRGGVCGVCVCVCGGGGGGGGGGGWGGWVGGGGGGIEILRCMYHTEYNYIIFFF